MVSKLFIIREFETNFSSIISISMRMGRMKYCLHDFLLTFFIEVERAFSSKIKVRFLERRSKGDVGRPEVLNKIHILR